MNKTLKWSLVAALVIAVGVWGYFKLMPHQNEELAKAEGMPKSTKKVLSVNAQIIKPHLLTDEIPVVGSLVPDEEVQLSFESAGKITDIFFEEGSFVEKGTLQAQLKSLEAKVPLAEERVYRQNALLQKDAVSKEALEIVKTELATLNADIEKVKAQIEMTELRAPFDGIIG